MMTNEWRDRKEKELNKRNVDLAYVYADENRPFHRSLIFFSPFFSSFIHKHIKYIDIAADMDKMKSLVT